MRQLFLIIGLIFIVVLGAGVVLLGAFPPAPHPQQVQHVVPLDRFQQH